MENVKIARDKLLRKLIENRAAHRDLFLKAQEGYRKVVVRELDKMLAAARNGRKISVQVNIRVSAPIDQTEDYDRAIAQLQWSEDKVVQLTEEEFNHYVLDQWRWTDQVSMSNAYYSKFRKY